MGDKDWQLDISEKIGEMHSDIKNLTKMMNEHLKDPYAHEQTRERSWKNLIPVIALCISLGSLALSASSYIHDRTAPRQANTR